MSDNEGVVLQAAEKIKSGTRFIWNVSPDGAKELTPKWNKALECWLWSEIEVYEEGVWAKTDISKGTLIPYFGLLVRVKVPENQKLRKRDSRTSIDDHSVFLNPKNPQNIPCNGLGLVGKIQKTSDEKTANVSLPTTGDSKNVTFVVVLRDVKEGEQLIWAENNNSGAISIPPKKDLIERFASLKQELGIREPEARSRDELKQYLNESSVFLLDTWYSSLEITPTLSDLQLAELIQIKKRLRPKREWKDVLPFAQESKKPENKDREVVVALSPYTAKEGLKQGRGAFANKDLESDIDIIILEEDGKRFIIVNKKQFEKIYSELADTLDKEAAIRISGLVPALWFVDLDLDVNDLSKMTGSQWFALNEGKRNLAEHNVIVQYGMKKDRVRLIFTTTSTVERGTELVWPYSGDKGPPKHFVKLIQNLV